MPQDYSQTYPGSSHRAHRMARWYEWLIAFVLVVALLGHFVIRPALESALPRIGQGLAVFLQGIAQFAQIEYATACDRIEHDPQLAVLLGGPITCPPIEQVHWLDSQGREELAFSFPINGPLASGEAHVVVPIVGDQPGPASITVALPNGMKLQLGP
jgi:hypothetical protein